MSIEIKNGKKSSWISCGMLCGFTHAVHQKYQHIGRRAAWKNEWTIFLWWNEALHHIFSHTFYWWTWQRKKIPENKQFIPHHLSRVKVRKKTRETLFSFAWKPKLYFSFWFGLFGGFFLLLRLMEFQRMWIFSVATSEFAKWLAND